LGVKDNKKSRTATRSRTTRTAKESNKKAHPWSADRPALPVARIEGGWRWGGRHRYANHRARCTHALALYLVINPLAPRISLHFLPQLCMSCPQCRAIPRLDQLAVKLLTLTTLTSPNHTVCRIFQEVKHPNHCSVVRLVPKRRICHFKKLFTHNRHGMVMPKLVGGKNPGSVKQDRAEDSSAFALGPSWAAGRQAAQCSIDKKKNLGDELLQFFDVEIYF
jgi:hypothetical protein